MKKIYYILFLGLFIFPFTAHGQIELETVTIKPEKKSKNTPGSPSNYVDVRYYYYPNLQAYFDLKEMKYIYKINNEWVKKDYIPPNYRGYCIFNKQYVVINDFFDDNPYQKLEEHKKIYPCNFKTNRPKPTTINNYNGKPADNKPNN